MVAKDFKVIATSNNIIVAISNDMLKLYGVQFHPEVTLSTNGNAMLKNFLYNITGLKGTFTMRSRESECIEYIRKVVGNNKVLVCFRCMFCCFFLLNNVPVYKFILFFLHFQNLVSGGVDSSVCAALLRKALNPDQVIAIHIDNGFMRKNESRLVEESLNKVGLDLKSK